MPSFRYLYLSFVIYVCVSLVPSFAMDFLRSLFLSFVMCFFISFVRPLFRSVVLSFFHQLCLLSLCVIIPSLVICFSRSVFRYLCMFVVYVFSLLVISLVPSFVV